jgi:TonB family protein
MSTIATTRHVYSSTALPAFEGDALEVQAHFHGQLIGTRHLQDAQSRYVIGATADADAPVAQEIIGADSIPLVTPWGQDYLVNVTPRMGGELWVNGRAWPLQDYVRERGRSFALPPHSQARVACGEVVFVLGRTSKPEKLPRQWLTWRWAEQKYTALSAMVLGLFLLAATTLPPDTHSLSLDDLGWTSLKLPNVTIPAVQEDVPKWLEKQDRTGNDEGKAAAGESGIMGNPKSQKTDGRATWKGPKDNPRPALSKEEAAKQAANTGILGILNQRDPAITSIFSNQMAMGQDPESVIGHLIGVQIGDASGGHGLGMLGTGAGGGGTGENTVGFGTLARIGTLGRGADGNREYGRTAGQFIRPKRNIGPDVIPGTLNVRGSLDKEIIRRIVRLHMNEVKYCYEKALTTQAGLSGRISVQFAIGQNGQVFSSVLQTSSMGNARVENCVVSAVRRWEFPKPSGGGMAIVVYPFNFSSPSS